MGKEVREYVALQLRIAAFEYAEKWGNVAKACRAFCVCRASYYRWKPAYDAEGVAGLKRKRPIAKNHPNRIPDETIQKVLELRTKYRLGLLATIPSLRNALENLNSGELRVNNIMAGNGLIS